MPSNAIGKLAGACTAVAVLCSPGCAERRAPMPLELDESGWAEAVPAGTACWDGSPWRFWFRPGNEEKIAVWFQGGGACWNDVLCDANRGPTPFDGSVSAADDHPRDRGGLFDRDREDNPLAEWSILFVPYCTADVHIGSGTVAYARGDGRTFGFAHEGQRNTRAVLDWLASREVAPETLLVTGESAGAIAASFWVADIAGRWPETRVIVLGDGAGGYRSPAVNPVLEQWGVLDDLPAVAAYRERDQVDFESFYIAAVEQQPRIELAQVNFADDAVQRQFMDLLGTPVETLMDSLRGNLAEIRQGAPGFRSFTLPGQAHIILATDALWKTRCEGVLLVDWISDLLDGQPVDDRWCE